MKQTGLSINKYIYAILSTSTELKEIVGNNIFPLVAEEETSFPFVVFRRNNITPNYAKRQGVNDLVSFVISIADTNYSKTVEISEMIRNELELHRDDYFQSIQLESVSEDFIENAYVQELNFNAIISYK